MSLYPLSLFSVAVSATLTSIPPTIILQSAHSSSRFRPTALSPQSPSRSAIPSQQHAPPDQVLTPNFPHPFLLPTFSALPFPHKGSPTPAPFPSSSPPLSPLLLHNPRCHPLTPSRSSAPRASPHRLRHCCQGSFSLLQLMAFRTPHRPRHPPKLKSL